MTQPAIILLIDKEAKNLHFIQRYLSLQGYVCHTADSVRPALDIIRSTTPDVVVISKASLGSDCFEIYQSLFKEPKLTRAQITIMEDDLGAPTPETILIRAQSLLRVKRTQDALQTRVQDIAYEGITDSQTGLWNVTQWNLRLSEEYERARRYNGSLSVVMVQIDGVDQLRQACGLAAADRLIAHAASLLLARVRNVDFLAYLGNGLFGVLMPQSPSSSAGRVVQRLREGISNIPLPLADQQKIIVVSASFGSSVLLAGDTSPGDMVGRAVRELKRLAHQAENSEQPAAPAVGG